MAALTKHSPGRPHFDFLEDMFRETCDWNPALLKERWRRMAERPLDFFRGSAPTFYRLWSRLGPRPASPVIWVCGDAHWENVGSYRGKNKVAYFDLNDFDQACLVPLEFELGRALSAYYVARMSSSAAHFLSAYRETLSSGKPQHIEREVAKGSVARLLDKVSERRRKQFLAAWTKGGRMRVIEHRTFALPRRERAEATRIFRAWAGERRQSAFFEMMDICGSLAGVGTLGLRRYLVLVRGGRHPHLIDMKEACHPALASLFPGLQPEWGCEAERIATVQNYTQYVPIAHLGWTQARGTSFVLSDFQPAEDRIDSLSLRESECEEFAKKWGRLLAWAHLRAASWKRGATVDALMAFGAKFDGRRQQVLLHRASEAGGVYARAFRDFLPLVETG